MCVIAVKPAGVAMPDEEALRACWQDNPDGAGFMYPDRGQVKIEKGFMEIESLLHRLDGLADDIDLRETALVMHFRIGTAGATSPENTHPFPVTHKPKDLRKTRLHCELGVCHNGCIAVKPRDKQMSDTMEYILAQLSLIRDMDPTFYSNPAAIQLIENQTRSKFAILSPTGETYTIGNYYPHEGVLYSNYSYLPWSPSIYTPGPAWLAGYHGRAGYDHDDDDLPSATASTSTSFAIRHRKAALCWLSSDREYVLTPEGDVTEGDDYLIDCRGEIYEYDNCDDLAYPIDGARIIPVSEQGTVFDYRASHLVSIPF